MRGFIYQWLPGRRDLLVRCPVGEISRSRCSRSAGACPPRALDYACANDGEGNPLACACGIRGPPRPTMRVAFFSERGGQAPAGAIITMCVSPSVVCDRLSTNRSGSGTPELQGLARPTVREWRFFRSAGACPPRALARADDGEGNPLGCACGIRGPSPYDEEGFLLPPYCIETGRSLLPGRHQDMKHPQLNSLDKK